MSNRFILTFRVCRSIQTYWHFHLSRTENKNRELYYRYIINLTTVVSFSAAIFFCVIYNQNKNVLCSSIRTRQSSFKRCSGCILGIFLHISITCKHGIFNLSQPVLFNFIHYAISLVYHLYSKSSE